jgi:predicted nucleic acid-binding protein
VIVVDASVALAWCLSDERDDTAESVLDLVAADGALAPAHWPLEVANGLLAAERRGRLTAADTGRALRLLLGLGVDILPVELSTAAGSVLDTGRDLRLTAYDAAYLDLARHRGIPLATLDQDLADACRSAGVALAA